MKIGIDISQIVYETGVSDYTRDLISTLISQYHENQYKLFAGTLRQKEKIISTFPQAKIFPIPPLALEILWNKLHAIEIEKLIGRIDIYHSSDWTQAPSKARKVTTIHDLSPFLYPEEMSSGGLQNIVRVHTRRMKWVTRECDKIICVSQNTAFDVMRLFKIKESKIVTIPEALPTTAIYQPTTQEITQIKNKYGLTSYILANGTLQPRKNIKRLVSCFLRYKDKYNLPEKLIVVGRAGWDNLKINNSAVIFAGFLPNKDLSSLFVGAQVFAYPSIYEGFGLPILKAFHHKTPVVTSNISSMPEVAGNAAILINPLDEEEIAMGIARAIKNREKLIASGTRQLAKFSWEKTAQETIKTYESLC